MVKSNRYSPTNKKFKSHFENFASDRVKKGHLSKNERDSDDTSIQTGILKRIDRKKLYDKGWEVEIDKKTYHCSYAGNVMAIPPSTMTDMYYVPKKKCEVEVQIDKVSKVYSITKIKDVNLTPIALYEDVVKISANTNTNTNKKNTASISISKTGIKLEGNIGVTNNIAVEGDITATNIERLENKVKTLEEESKDNSDIEALQKEISELKKQIADLQATTEDVETEEGETEEGDTNDG